MQFSSIISATGGTCPLTKQKISCREPRAEGGAEKTCWRIVSLILLFALTDCSTDQQRTRTEGTVIGGVFGAILGGVAGAGIAAATGNSDHIGEYAAAGAAGGALLGSIAGYNWGTSVARKKEQYVRAEDYLNACINDAQKCAQAAQKENQFLRDQIAQLNQEVQRLQVNYQKGRATRQNLVAQAEAINKRRADVQQKIQHVGDQISSARQALGEAGLGTGTSQKRIEVMRSEIAALSAEKVKMQAQNQQLARISGRLGV
jgi:uncharacterized small protein (DUF1192 family)